MATPNLDKHFRPPWWLLGLLAVHVVVVAPVQAAVRWVARRI